MKIGIDARVLDRKMTGTGRYLLNLLNGIPQVDPINEYFVFMNNTSLIDNSFFKLIPIPKSIFPDKIYSFIWLNFILPKQVKKLKLDIFFTCNILLPLVNFEKTKKITVIHDVIHKARPDFYPLSYRLYLNILLPFTIKSADFIITASMYSKKDIIKYFRCHNEKLEYIHTSAEPKFQIREIDQNIKTHIRQKYNLPEKFLLFVGVIERRKNINGLFQIEQKLDERGVNLPLVLVGRTGYGYESIQNLVKKSNGKVIYIDYVQEEDLPIFYNLAFVFLFPSFYEGFGIPPLEAMQSGLPTIVSNLTSLPEVVGDAAIKVNPYNIDEMVKKIIMLYEDKVYYHKLRQLGIQKATEFSQFKSAKKLVEIFNKFNNN